MWFRSSGTSVVPKALWRALCSLRLFHPGAWKTSSGVNALDSQLISHWGLRSMWYDQFLNVLTSQPTRLAGLRPFPAAFAPWGLAEAMNRFLPLCSRLFSAFAWCLSKATCKSREQTRKSTQTRWAPVEVYVSTSKGKERKWERIG